MAGAIALEAIALEAIVEDKAEDTLVSLALVLA
jgi:hypothetical protein